MFTSGWHNMGAQLRSPLEQNMEYFEQNTQNKKKPLKWMESRANICVRLSETDLVQCPLSFAKVSQIG